MTEPLITEQRQSPEIPPKVARLIETEAQDIKEDAQEFGQETAEILSQMVIDLRKGEYLALKWLNQQQSPGIVLYPGSGTDNIPKHVFGTNNVVHMSLEDYWIKRDKKRGQEYLKSLGEGVMTIADVDALPLQDASVDLVVLLESDFINDPHKMKQLTRVLKNNGRILLSIDFTSPEEQESKREKLANLTHGLTLQKLPEETDYPGEIVDIEYYVLVKGS